MWTETLWVRDIWGREGLQVAEATTLKDNRDGEGKKSSQEMGARKVGGGGGNSYRGEEKERLTHAALALDRALLSDSSKTFFFFKEINIFI